MFWSRFSFGTVERKFSWHHLLIIIIIKYCLLMICVFMFMFTFEIRIFCTIYELLCFCICIFRVNIYVKKNETIKNRKILNSIEYFQFSVLFIIIIFSFETRPIGWNEIVCEIIVNLMEAYQIIKKKCFFHSRWKANSTRPSFYLSVNKPYIVYVFFVTNARLLTDCYIYSADRRSSVNTFVRIRMYSVQCAVQAT